jgi:hypothetical protein
MRLRDHFDRISRILFAELFTGNVEHLTLTEHEGNQRAPVAKTLDLKNILEPVAVKACLICNENLIFFACG